MSVKLEHRTGIQAPDEVVWDVLSDIQGWASWNPLYPKAEGVIRIGAVWDLELALPDQTPRLINPVILDWAPYDHIHWRLTALRGWVRTIRFLEIEKMGPENCIFSNGELFEGLFGGLVARRLRGPIRQGFAAMGEALKERSEALWAARK
ncbi:MAG: SRPBCC domain-containing protein [Caulobacter sp.]|nr:SRPBCC domain-containing protein [Caulobacter sp.]